MYYIVLHPHVFRKLAPMLYKCVLQHTYDRYNNTLTLGVEMVYFIIEPERLSSEHKSLA